MADRGVERDATFLVRLDDSGVVRLTWASCRAISRDLAREAMVAVDEIAGGRPRPLYVEMSGVPAVSRDGREAFTRPCLVSRIALVGQSAVDRMVALCSFGTSPALVPTHFFTSERLALEWLLESRGKQPRP